VYVQIGLLGQASESLLKIHARHILNGKCSDQEDHAREQL
jgi:hypothetical protein